MDVEGENNLPNGELKGPALIICNHTSNLLDSCYVQSLTNHHIYWIGDIYLFQSTTIRLHHRRGFKWFFDTLGIIEVNRKNPIRALRTALEKSLHVFEKGGLVGIFPLGTYEEIKGKWDTYGHAGAVGILQYAEKYLHTKIAIIPVGVIDGKRILVRFGKQIMVPNNLETPQDRKTFAKFLLTTIRQLET